MFKIIKNTFGNIDCITLKNIENGIEVQILHGFGAIINKYIVNQSPFSFIAGYHSAEELLSKNPFFSRSAKLFPFPNRLNKGEYGYLGKTYSLPANFTWSEHAVHGLLYNQPFELIAQNADANSASVRLRFDTSTLPDKMLCGGFPFSFRLDIEYHVSLDGTLRCKTSVENIGDTSFPFGDAWHPYFSLGASLSDCLLTMPACQQVLHSDDLPNGELAHYDEFVQPVSLHDRTFNDCFVFESIEPTTLSLARSNGSASLHFQQSSAYPFVQLYTPSSESSLAIEPMTCPADAFNNGIGLLELGPKQTLEFEWQCLGRYHD